jgi:hypothetical protein
MEFEVGKSLTVCCLGICLQGLVKTTNILSRASHLELSHKVCVESFTSKKIPTSVIFSNFSQRFF